MVSPKVLLEDAALIDRWFYPCDAAHLGGLAEMYDCDTRFQASFEAFGDGTVKLVIAAFRAAAVSRG